jgi:hypothetical protein
VVHAGSVLHPSGRPLAADWLLEGAGLQPLRQLQECNKPHCCFTAGVCNSAHCSP